MAALPKPEKIYIDYKFIHSVFGLKFRNLRVMVNAGRFPKEDIRIPAVYNKDGSGRLLLRSTWLWRVDTIMGWMRHGGATAEFVRDFEESCKRGLDKEG